MNLPASGDKHEFYTAQGVKKWMDDAYRLRGFYDREEGPSGQIERRAWVQEVEHVTAEIAAAMRRKLEAARE